MFTVFIVHGPSVTPSQCLNHFAREDRYANLGLSGLHDMALFGLLKDYGKAIAGKKVLLHFDPLWMHSVESDLQGEKEFHLLLREVQDRGRAALDDH